KLYEKARSTLKELGYSVRFKHGDGTKGWSPYSPYDAIVVTAGAPAVPGDLVAQLNVSGPLVVPAGDEKRQERTRRMKTRKDEYKEEHYSDFKFVPLIGEKGWQE